MLQYQVDKNGMVVKVSTSEGKPYEVTSQRVTNFPAPVRLDRWSAFKRAVCTQELDVVMRYSGWANAKEMKLAMHTLNRQTRDAFMLSALNGSKLRIQSDPIELVIYVAKVKNDN